MSITTRDLKLRQKEVDKNLNETYSTLRKQPEGGLGAMIQKPNHFEPPIKRVPTLFTPSPMLSSLPYLAEWVKVRSNEVAINTTAHLIRQREAAKASFLYDDIKQNNMDMRNEEVSATVSRNFAPSTADLLRKYLSNEIEKQRDGERKIQEERMKRVDLQMNPVRPEAPAVAPPLLRTLTSGDMGRPNVPDQAEIRALRNAYYDRQEQGRQYDEMQREALAGADETIARVRNKYTRGYDPVPADESLRATFARARQAQAVANDAKDQAVKRKFTNLAEGLVANENGRAMGTMDMVKELRKFKEDQKEAVLNKFSNMSKGLVAKEKEGVLSMVQRLKKFKEDEKAVEDAKMEKAIKFNKQKTFEKAVASMKAEKFYDESMRRVKAPQIQMLRDLNATLPNNQYYDQGAFTTSKEDVARAVALATLRGQVPASATTALKAGNVRRELAKGIV